MIKQLVKVVDGKLRISNEQFDADLLEISKEPNNSLEVKEDGLFYKEKELGSGLELINNKIELTKVDAGNILLSLSDHIKKLYEFISLIKGIDLYTEIESINELMSILDEHKSEINLLKNNVITTRNSTGLLSGVKIFIGKAKANSDGIWSVDYSSTGFTEVPLVFGTGITTGGDLADRRFVSLNSNHTITNCSGVLLSSSSVGLLAAMTMVVAAGDLNILAIGV